MSNHPTLAAQVQSCPADQLFDGWACSRRTNYTCAPPRHAPPSCDAWADGYYAAPDDDCRSFYACKQRTFVSSFKCNSGLIFNGKKCVESKSLICSPRAREPDCTLKVDGYYKKSDENCRAFYYCKRGVKQSEHNCPGRYVFNGRQCVSPRDYTCRESSRDT